MQSRGRLAWGRGLAAGGVGPSALRVPRTAAPCLCPWGYEHAVSLSRPCLGYDGCSVLFQSSMEELGRGAHSPAGKFFPSMLLCHIPKCVLWGGRRPMAHLGRFASPPRLCWVPKCTPHGPGLLPSCFSESAPLVPRASSPTTQLLCYRLGQPPDGWKVLGGVGDLPTPGSGTAGPKTPLG